MNKKAVDNPQTENDIERIKNSAQPVEIDILGVREALLEMTVVARDVDCRPYQICLLYTSDAADD